MRVYIGYKLGRFFFIFYLFFNVFFLDYGFSDEEEELEEKCPLPPSCVTPLPPSLPLLASPPPPKLGENNNNSNNNNNNNNSIGASSIITKIKTEVDLFLTPYFSLSLFLYIYLYIYLFLSLSLQNSHNLYLGPTGQYYTYVIIIIYF